MIYRRLTTVVLLAALIGLAGSTANANTIATTETQATNSAVVIGDTGDPAAVVTALLNHNGVNWSFLVNDGTGSLAIFGNPGSYVPTLGDSVKVTGNWSPFHQIPEIANSTTNPLTVTLISAGNTVPAPLNLTIPDLNVSPLPMNIAGYYITLSNVSVLTTTGATPSGNWPTANTEYRVDDGTNRMVLYYWPISYSVSLTNLGNQPIPTWPVNITGIISVFTSGSTNTPEFTPISISTPPGVFGVAGSASPNPVVAGTSITFTSIFSPGANPASTGVTVTANLSAIGGASAQAFTAGAALPDGTIPYTFTMDVPCSAPAGDQSLPLVAKDQQLRELDTVIPLTIQSGAPGISIQPSDSQVCAGGTARFSVVATGASLSYLWYNGSGPLSDSGNISGSTTPNLAISNIGSTDVSAGPYHVVVTASCPAAGTTLPSNSVNLILGTPATTLQKQVVISQVYGGGGNSGSKWKNDFIELFNRGPAEVDISNWSVQYAARDKTSATVFDTSSFPNFGTPVRMTVIPAGTPKLQPGHFYLIREAYGTGGTDELPSFDLDATQQAGGPIEIGASGGKLALVNNSTPLTGTCPVTDLLCTLVDYLGWDEWTLCFDGSGAAPFTTNTTSVIRNSACIDTDDNASDFTYTATITPHSGTSPVAPTILTQPTDQAACVGQTATFTVVADGPCLTYHWQVFANGSWTNVTTGTGDGTASFTTATLAADDIGTQYRVVLSSPYGSDATSNAVTVTSGVPTEQDMQVVINQVYGGGGNQGAPYQNDFIELYNKGPTSVNLTGWSLQYASAAGNTWSNKTDLSGIIQPGHFFLVKESAGSGCSGQPCGDPLPVAANITGTIALGASAGKVALLKTTTVLGAVYCPSDGDCRVVDFVGYGTTANCYEGGVGHFAPAPSNTTAIMRNPAGHDTDDNQADFIAGAPQLTHNAPVDYNNDGFVNNTDFDLFQACFTGPSVPLTPGCESKDLDHDGDVDDGDFGLFQKCFSGTSPADINCLTLP